MGPPAPDMVCYPVQPLWMQRQPATYLRGPVPISGLCCFPQPPVGRTVVVPPPPYTAQAIAPPPPRPTKAASKRNNPWAPPKVDAKKGESYMFDRAENHMHLHIFNKAAPVWTSKYEKQNLSFKIFKVSVNFTVKMVIENTLKKSEEVCKAWAVTEVTERGGGKWNKGMTIAYDSDAAKKSLKDVGWSAKRGGTLPPVWIVVHKADLK